MDLHDLKIDRNLSDSDVAVAVATACSTVKMERDLDCQLFNSQPRVSFSETSLLSFYEDDNDYLHPNRKYYSQEDEERFNKAATKEADRIKSLIISAPQESRVDSINYLIKKKILKREELVGIEHLIFNESSCLAKIRKRYSKVVLKKQQKNQQRDLPLENSAATLGKFARKESLESRYCARTRAILCCGCSCRRR